MKEEKTVKKEESKLHPRNPHGARYDFEKLTKALPELKPFILLNKYKSESIDFADPLAVKTLNQALLKQYYGIKNWDIPQGYLCPPIPGRADYIHYAADLLGSCNEGEIPEGKEIKIMDVGVGANCIYPLIGNNEFSWSFVGTDVDKVALESAFNITQENNFNRKTVQFRLQPDPTQVIHGLIEKDDAFDLLMCNPPFHTTKEEAEKGNRRKRKNLGIKKSHKDRLNFGGMSNELWYPGGEKEFVRKLIEESRLFPTKCFWYTSLISKKDNLPFVLRALKKTKATEMMVVEMKQGQKQSRFIAWTFLSPEEKLFWKTKRWDKGIVKKIKYRDDK